MLQNLTGLMSDRASVMKSFDNSFNQQRQQTLRTNENMEFLHCNAHFLLVLSTASEKVLKDWCKDEMFGRDKADKFRKFSNASESPAARHSVWYPRSSWRWKKRLQGLLGSFLSNSRLQDHHYQLQGQPFQQLLSGCIKCMVVYVDGKKMPVSWQKKIARHCSTSK